MLRFALSSLRFHWRVQAAVALGVAAATAVLTGALLVGDSVRGSLRHLVLDRLGRIDQVLVVDRFIRQEMAAELAQQPRFKQADLAAAPAVLFPAATVQSDAAGGKRRAAGVTVIGSGGSFWDFEAAQQRPKRPPGDGEIVVSAPLAEELQAKMGDTLVVRLGKSDQVPADSPLGRRTGRIAALAELKLIEVIPAAGLGQFSLQQSQIAPRNAYVSLGDVQRALDQAERVNAIFVGGRSSSEGRSSEKVAKLSAEELDKLLQPRLIDYGLTLQHVKMNYGAGAAAETIYDYYSLSSERLLIEPAMERVVRRALQGTGAEALLTYLANDMRKIRGSGDRLQGSGDRGQESAVSGIPYSTITAIDPAPGGPLVDETGRPLAPLADDEIVLTSWSAEDQQASVGDRIRVSFFEPETTHGEARETSVEFRVKAIVPLTEPANGFSRRGPAVYDQRPTPANDPHLTPEVKGITDQATIADWDPPFPFDQKRIRPQDDTFWENHRTTPKAFVSLAAGQRLWGSRFGHVTSFRIPAAAGVSQESLEEKLLAAAKTSNERLGLDFIPIKQQGLKAASGTTPFDVLFLLLSMFIIAAAIMLVWLLFRLGVEQRAGEIGLLLSLGWKRTHVRRLLVLEGSLVAAAGAALGVCLGLGYAWLMLAGLRSWWIGAIATPFLALYVSPLSPIVGLLAGTMVSIATIWLSLGRMRRAVVRQLLAGEIVNAGAAAAGMPAKPASKDRPAWIAAALFVVAVGLAFLASRLGGEAQAGAFMAAGAALLVSVLMLVHRQIGAGGRDGRIIGRQALGRLALRNAGRNTSRSTATIALVASAAFLIVAVSAFRMSPSSAGVGGFDLLAESSQPIYADLNSPAGRGELLADQAAELAGATVLSLRLKAGDDASCRNLYQPTQPRVLGVTPQMISYFDEVQLPNRFAWSASGAKSPTEKANPWRLLGEPTPADKPMSVVLDQNTAMYSLRLYGGVGQEFDVTYSDGTAVKFRVVGLLANSVLQGSLLIGEADFQRLFPQISGYRFFLIKTPPGKADALASLLEDRLGDEGFDTVDARGRLAELLTVQNTYISTFQSLGALGLVLGTFGLGAVQLRSVLERRKELALMRAAGFRRWRLGEMVLLENLVLLIGGLGIGTLAALVAVLPQMLLGGAHVPLADLAMMLGIVLTVGIVTGMIAVRATMRAPLVAALRGE